MTVNTIVEPSVYCGTYAKYNNGSIKGKWLKLAEYEDETEFWNACKELHKDESDPEYMFQDFEGFPKSEYSESGMDFEKLIEYANLTEDERETVDAYIEATGYPFADIELNEIEEKVIFIEDNSNMSSIEVQYAEDWAQSTGDIPDHLSWYINWERYGEDLLQNYMVADGYVFDNS